jgi:thymidylate synthase (FAD)
MKGHSAKYVHSTPNGDQMIAEIARVSNPNGPRKNTDPELIRFLLKNNHWSPFQMASLCIDLHTTRPIGRQVLRHLSAIGYQEYSGRYATYDQLNDFLDCRFQHPTNRQMSRPPETEEERQTAREWDAFIVGKAKSSQDEAAYWLGRGVAKEQVRGVLPEGLVPTDLYAHFSIRTWIHYIEERTKPGVQLEHQHIAMECEEILIEKFPMVAEAAGFCS